MSPLWDQSRAQVPCSTHTKKKERQAGEKREIYIYISREPQEIIAYANYFDINGLKPDRNKGRDKLPCESLVEQTVYALN